MLRRSLLKSLPGVMAGLATASVLAVGATAETQKIDLRLGFIANVQNADLYIAIDQGIFEQNGMEVNLIPGGPGAANSLTELAADNVQIALGTWVAFVDSIQKGNDFVLIGTQFQSSPLGLISLANDPILTAEDIVGAKILAQGKPAENGVRAVLMANGLDPDSVEFLPTGFSPEPLLAGDGKGYTAFGTNQAVVLEMMGHERGKDFHFRTFDELGTADLAGMFVVKRDYLEANRDMLVRFFASLIEAQQINEQDVSVGATLAVEKFGIDYGLDLESQTLQNTRQLEFVRPGGDPDFKLYSLDQDKISGPMMETLTLLGRTDLPENILNNVDFSIVEEAYKLVNG